MDDLCLLKRLMPIGLLALFWAWETWRPYFGHRAERWPHAARNLGLALVNTVLLGLLFGTATATVAAYAEERQLGLLRALTDNATGRFVMALVLLDAWMYCWHRANHAVPLLWRCHRTHHSDPHMDVTTATRFHLGELLGAASARLVLIPALGFEVWQLVTYDLLLLAVTQFHHADISLGRWERWLRLVLVTPDLHKVHHSAWQPETDSNYAVVLSVWDRLAGTLRLRANPRTIVFGLEECAGPRWQSWWGLWRTPFLTAAGHNISAVAVQASTTPAVARSLSRQPQT